MKQFLRTSVVALAWLSGLVSPASGASCVPPPSNQVAWWRAEGDTMDSGSINHGTMHSDTSPTTFSPGLVGQAFSFDGLSTYLEILQISLILPSVAPKIAAVVNPGTNDFTVEFWVQTSATQLQAVLGTRRACGHGSFWECLMADGGGLTFELDNNGLDSLKLGPTRRVNDGLFHHVALVRQGGLAAIYVDGTMDVSASAARSTVLSNSVSLVVGRSPCGNTHYFAGAIDELAAYNRGLAAAEIQGIFNAGSAGRCLSPCLPAPAGLLHWYRGEGDGSDAAGSNDGTLEPGVTFTSAGKVGGALAFNGASGGVNLGNLTDLDSAPARSFSIEAWFNYFGPSDPTNNFQTIVALNQDCLNQKGEVLGIINTGTNAGRIGLGIAVGRFLGGVSTVTVSSNQLHHVVAVWNADARFPGQASIYLDGVLVGLGGYPSSLPPADEVSASDWIGRGDCGGPFDVFNGVIDEVSIYGRALHEAEVLALFFAGSAGKCPFICAPAPAGLVSWYPGEGTGNDSIGTNSPTQTLGTPQFPAAQVGRGIKFDGNSGVVLADSPSLNVGAADSFSIEAWVRLDGIPREDSVLLDKRRPGGGPGYALGVLGSRTSGKGVPFASISDGANSVAVFGLESLDDGHFHHVLVTVDRPSSSLAMYVDGGVARTNTIATLGSLGNSGRLFIGHPSLDAPGTNAVPLNGVVDELSFYNRALSAAEAVSLFRAGRAGKCASAACAPVPAGLVSWYPGEGNGGDVAGGNSPSQVLGSPQFVNAKVGRGIQFNGSSGLVTADSATLNFDATSSFALEAWTRIDGVVPSDSLLVDKRQPGGGIGYGLGVLGSGSGPDARSYYFFLQDGGHHITAQTLPVADSGFHHLAAVLDRSSGLVVVYLDGVPQQAKPIGALGGVGNTGRFFLGQQSLDVPGTTGVPFQGVMDELAVYSRALSAGDVQSIFHAGSAGKCTTAACAPTPPGLVHWYRGESDGRDSAGNSLGALEPGVTAGNPGEVGGAFHFNGSGGGVNLGNVPDLDFAPNSSFSIEAWFNNFGPTALPNDAQAIVSLNYNCGNPLDTAQIISLANVGANAGKVSFTVRDANSLSDLVVTPFPVSTNQFHHVVAVREVNGNTKSLRLYLDGALVDSKPDPTTGALAIDVPDWIGRRNTCGTDNVFNGLIDEVSIYSRALTSTEVAAVFNAGSAGKCGGVASPSVLSGIVRDAATGAGLAGVSIAVSGSISTNVTTFANGAFSIPVPSRGACTLTPVLDRYGFVPASLSFSNPPPQVSNIQFTGQVQQIDVSVLLRQTNGAPIAAGLVTLDNALAGQLTTVSDGSSSTLQFSQTAPARQGFTDAQGTYTFTNVPNPGRYRVSASKADFVFRPASATVLALGLSQTVTLIGTSNLSRTVSGHITFPDGSPAANVPVLVSAPAADGSVRLVGSRDLTDLNGYFVHSNLAAVAACFVAPSAINRAFSPVSRSVSLLDSDATADFVVIPRTWRIHGRISPAANVTSSADITVLVAFTDTAVGANVGNSATIISAASRVGDYTSPPLPEGHSYLVQPIAAGLLFTPDRLPFPSLVADVTNANFTFARFPVDITGRVTNSSGFGLSAASVTLSGAISVTQQVGVDGSYAFYNVPFGQTYILSATHTNFFFDPTSALLPNLSSSSTQSFSGRPILPLSGRIAFLRNTELMVMNADSSLPLTVPKVFADGLPVGRAALSPDGTKLAYVAVSSSTFPSKPYPLVVQEVDGSNVRLLTGLDEVAVSPAWSPDSTQVAVVIRASASRPAGVYLLPIDGSSAFRLPNCRGQERNLAWSPDGTQIAFDALVNNGSNNFGSLQIFVTGTNDPSPPQAQVSGAQPAWSPDGTQIAFLAKAGAMRVGNLPALAATSHALPGRGSTPAWSPDGAFLAFNGFIQVPSNSAPVVPGQVEVVNTNGTFETPLGVGKFPSWSRTPELATPPGNNVTVSSGITAVNFSSVTTPGTTTVIPTPPPASALLPPGYVSISGGATLMNFEVTTTAGHSGPISLCFTLASITDAATFDSLRVLHNENGVLVDRTVLPPDPQAPNFAARTICARVDSLSPFSLAQRVNPVLPMVTGLVVDPNGNPVAGVALSISGNGSFPARTDARGIFTFPNLGSGGPYAVLPSDDRYDFNPPLALLEQLAGTNTLVFVATAKNGPSLTIIADASTPGQFTLAWPATSLSYTLEFSESLAAPTWDATPVQPFIQDGNNIVTLQASSAPLFFRLRQQ